MDKLPVILAIVLYVLIYFLRLHQGGWDPKLDLFPNFRQNLDKEISRNLPSPQAELLSGILLGSKKDLPPEFRLALRDTSTLHIVVVSGQNLTLLASLFLKLSGLLKRKTAIFLSIIAVIFYTVLTGGQIPVVRAAIMAILAFSAEAFGRQKDGIWALFITGGVMLLINPAWIGDLSFQLSFLATFGVIALAPIIERYLTLLPPFIKQDVGITLGAQLMVIPVIAQIFHQVSLVGVVANLLVGWTIPIIMILGVLMIVLGSVFNLLVSIFLTYFIYIVSFFANLPFAWEYVGEKVLIFWIGYYLVLASMLLFMLSLNNDKKEIASRFEKGS